MSPSPQDIQAREFREAFRGYHQDDVDAFLDEVAEEQGRLLQDNQRLRIQSAALQQEVARLREARDSDVSADRDGAREEAKEELKDEARRALVAAQKAADSAVEEAKRDAARIIAEAQQRARDIGEGGAGEGGAGEGELGVATTIEELQQGIDDLRRKEMEIRTRVRSMLEEQLRVVDQFEARAHHAATVERIAEALGEDTPEPEPDPQRFWTDPGGAPEGD